MWNPFGTWYTVIEWVVFVFYVIDVFVALRTSFQNILGDEVTDGKLIAKRYIFSLQFLLDILSLLSNPAIERIPGKAASLLNLCALLKVQRYFRFAALISQSDSRLQTKVLLRILYDIVLLFIYVHITGCCFYWVIKSNPKANWIPPFDYNDGSKSVFYTQPGGEPQTWTYQYGVCLYYMMLVIGGNEMGPSDVNELVFIAAMSSFGLIIKVILFGELSVLMSSLASSDANQQKVIDTANIAMANMELQQKTRKSVREYFLKVQETSDKQTELNDFLGEISPSLKKKIQGEIFTTSISKNGILANVIRIIRRDAENTKLTGAVVKPLMAGNTDSKLLGSRSLDGI